MKTLIEGVYDLNLYIDAEAYENRQELIIRADGYRLYQNSKGRESDTIAPSLFSFTVEIPEGQTDFMLEEVMNNNDDTWIDTDAEGIPAWLAEQITKAASAVAEPEPEPGYRFKVGDKVRPKAGTGRLGKPYMYAVGRIGTVVAVEPRVSYGVKVTFDDVDVDYLKNVPYHEDELTDRLTTD